MPTKLNNEQRMSNQMTYYFEQLYITYTHIATLVRDCELYSTEYVTVCVAIDLDLIRFDRSRRRSLRSGLEIWLTIRGLYARFCYEIRAPTHVFCLDLL